MRLDFVMDCYNCNKPNDTSHFSKKLFALGVLFGFGLGGVTILFVQILFG